MRKVIGVTRNTNKTIVYFVIRDGTRHTVEVYRWPATGTSITHVVTRAFIAHPDGWHRVSDSERDAVQRCVELVKDLARTDRLPATLPTAPGH